MKLLFLLFLLFFTASFSAENNSQNVKIKSDKISRDNNTIIAIGDVNIEQNGMLISADEVKYDTENKEIQTDNPIRVHDKNRRKIYYAEKAKMKTDLSSAEYTDGVLILNNGTVLHSKYINQHHNQYELRYAKYSACPTDIFEKLEEQSKNVKSNRVQDITNTDEIKENDRVSIYGTTIELDTDENSITAWNGLILYYNVPIFYFPYLYGSSNGDYSGFKNPGIIKSRNFGYGAYISYFLKRDEWNLNFKPTIYQKGNYTLNTTFTNKYLNITGDIANDNGQSKKLLTETSQTEYESGMYKQHRGFVNGRGGLKVENTNWNVNYNAYLVSDKYYMRDYYNVRLDYTTSNLIFNNVNNKTNSDYNYFSMNNIFYQELDTNLKKDDATPLYAPNIDWNLEKENYGLYVNTTSLVREHSSLYNRNNYNKLTINPHLKYTVDNTLGTLNVNGNLTSNFYHIIKNNSTATSENVSIINTMPQFNAEWSKNLIIGDALLKPIVKYSYSPKVKTGKIENEDSSGLSLNFNNIWSDNKYIGYDRMEYGNRVNYGIESMLFNNLTLGLAQGYNSKIKEQETINGFDNKVSDYLGYTALRFNEHFDLHYRFMIDKDNGNWKKNEATMSASYGIFTSYLTYLREVKPDKTDAQINLNVKLQLTKSLSVSGDITRELQFKKNTQINGAISYDDGCVIWTLNYTKDNPLDGSDINKNISLSYNIKFF